MLSRRALLLLILPTAVAAGGCHLPGGTPPTPQVVQETEPNNSTTQANALPLAPDTATGSVGAADDPGRYDYWTYTPDEAGVLDVDIECSTAQIVNLLVFTATDTGDLNQCGAVSLALDAGEQAFVSAFGVTPNPSYTLSATFTPGP
jgi:hypothetical protein